MNQTKVIPFPDKSKSQKTTDPERIIIISTDEEHEYRIKAKYKKIITDVIRHLL